MQEEIERQTVALVFKAGKLTGETLADAIGRALNRGLNFHKAEKEAHGKMSLSELVGKGNKTEKLEFSEENLKAFHKTAMKYNLDYAVHKEAEGNLNKYYVFFQAKDTAVIESAFKEFVTNNEKQKDSVQKKLKEKEEIVKKRKEKEMERAKERNKERVR